MNTDNKLRHGGLLLAVVAAFGLSPSAWAATAADTNVTNTATVAYSVNSVPQTDIDSNTDDFEVDRLIDVSVVEDVGTETDVTPDQTTFANTIRFLVTNQGNDTQDILLVASNQADGTDDPFGLTGVDSWNTVGAFAYYRDDGDGVFEPGAPVVGITADTALPAGGGGVYLDEVPAGASRVVWVEPADIPANDPTNLLDGDPDKDMDDGNLAVVSLLGTVRAGGGAAALGAALANDTGADVQGSVQNVFGDPDGPYDGALDAADSDDSAFQVATAVITLAKSSAVTNDPINLGVNPKRIPGATIRYTVIVSNGALATAAASSVTIDDVVDTATLDETTIVLFFDADDDGTCETNGTEDGHASITFDGVDTVSIDVDAAEGTGPAGDFDGDGELDAGESLRFCFDIEIR